MTDPNNVSPGSLMVISIHGSTSAVYSLDEVARIARVHPERLRFYCQRGLFGDALARTESEPTFDNDQLYEVRRFEHFRQQQGVDPKTLRLLCDLWRELERLKAELDFFRNR
jgi:DNA-binding transcriptional MerR regulator